MKNTNQQCCKLNDHTFCHTCDKDLHDSQIDNKGCDEVGLIEATCKECIKEWKEVRFL